jgi:hypothetical protein
VPSANEALGKQSAMEATLDQGVQQLGVRQTVRFQQFAKRVVSQDGFVFWVATSKFATITGALHFATDRMQDEDQTIAANQVLLTAEEPITEFNAIDPSTMWIGAWPLVVPGAPTLVEPAVTLEVAFAKRGNYFGPANLWHYSGFAVFPALSAQLIQTEADLPAGPIVSNSLPIWLSQTTVGDQTVPVYPSFLVPDNIKPPYIVAHVDPDRTEALAAALILMWPGTTIPDSGASPLHSLPSSQLMRDEVDLILYGFNNQMAIQYLVGLLETSLLGMFGFANSPAIHDEKRVQVELAALAQKKTIHVSANYYQGTSDAIARRLILDAEVASVTIGALP